jgi:hypothetical protein
MEYRELSESLKSDPIPQDSKKLERQREQYRLAMITKAASKAQTTSTELPNPEVVIPRSVCEVPPVTIDIEMTQTNGDDSEMDIPIEESGVISDDRVVAVDESVAHEESMADKGSVADDKSVADEELEVAKQPVVDEPIGRKRKSAKQRMSAYSMIKRKRDSL